MPIRHLTVIVRRLERKLHGSAWKPLAPAPFVAFAFAPIAVAATAAAATESVAFAAVAANAAASAAAASVAAIAAASAVGASAAFAFAGTDSPSSKQVPKCSKLCRAVPTHRQLSFQPQSTCIGAPCI